MAKFLGQREGEQEEHWILRRARETVLPQIQLLKEGLGIEEEEALLLYAVVMLSSISYNMSIATKEQREIERKRYGKGQ